MEYIVNKLFIDAVSTVDNICLPIKKLGITFFVYLKNFNDGSQINFSNDKTWLENYYKFKLYKKNIFENHPCSYKTGIFMSGYYTNNLKFVNYKQNDIYDGYGLTIIERKLNDCEFFSFFGNIKDYWLINFYINNLHVLKKFTLYFKCVFNETLKKAEKNKIIIPRSWNNLNFKEQQILYNMQDQVLEFEKIIEKELLKHIASFKLSTREKDIIKQLKYGRTSKEIGKFFGISYRTVEKHLENIKLKCNCNTKFEVINNIDLIDFDNILKV